MKERFQDCILSIAVVLALTLLFSLIFACLYYFNFIQTQTFHILNWMGGIIAFGAGGVALGIKIEKKALLHAFCIAILFGIIAVCIKSITIISLIEITSKLLCYIFCCMLCYARKRKN